jgi:hypothetical protein
MSTYSVQYRFVGPQTTKDEQVLIKSNCRGVSSWVAHGITHLPGIEARIKDLNTGNHTFSIIPSDSIPETVKSQDLLTQAVANIKDQDAISSVFSEIQNI